MLIKKEECDETLEIVSKCECWLCLRVADASDCILFNEIHKEILEVLLANEVTNSVGFVVCNNCINMLHESFAFKSVCLYTEDSVTPFINSEDFSELDIFMVFLEVHKDKTELLSKDSKVCRFCLKILKKISYTFLKDLNEQDFKMLKKVTPEVQLEAIKEPIICEVCLHCFQDSLEFVNMCLNALKWCDDSSQSNLNGNLAPIGDSGNNLVSSEVDSKISREPNDGSVLNPKETKLEPDLFESIDTNCLKIDHASEEESSQTFKCLVCDLVTEDEDSLTVHMSVHTSSEIKLDNSEESTIQRDCKNNLVDYNLVHNESEETELYLYDFEENEKPEKGQLYKCQLCKFSTKRKRNLKDHEIRHKNPEEIKLFKCQMCEFSTQRKRYLVTHQIVHKNLDEIMLHKCKLCQFSTKYKRSLENHQLIMHETSDEAKLYKCQLCEFSTKRKSGLANHQIVHKKPGEVKLYKCQLCQFSTKYKHSIIDHQIVHKESDEVKLHKCQLCQFSSKHKSSLKKHQVMHEKPDEMKLYKCQLCEYSTKYKRCLGYHQAVHNNPDKNNFANASCVNLDPNISTT